MMTSQEKLSLQIELIRATTEMLTLSEKVVNKWEIQERLEGLRKDIRALRKELNAVETVNI